MLDARYRRRRIEAEARDTRADEEKKGEEQLRTRGRERI
jgi:hypothetical protein